MFDRTRHVILPLKAPTANDAQPLAVNEKGLNTVMK